MKLYPLIPFVLATPVFADGHSAVQLGQETAPTQWQGEAVHFAIDGVLSGDILNLSNLPPAGVRVEGQRTYAQGTDWMPYKGFDMTLSAQGISIFSVAIESVDLTAHFLPVDLPVAPQASADDVAVTFIFGPGTESERVMTGWTGNLSFELDDQADYPAEDGNVGGFLTVERGDDQFSLSFTVPMVGANIIE